MDHIPLSRMLRGGLVLLLMANGGALPGSLPGRRVRQPPRAGGVDAELDRKTQA
jgi:hypothetical protein